VGIFFRISKSILKVILRMKYVSSDRIKEEKNGTTAFVASSK
jgi:hypothetical protein